MYTVQIHCAIPSGIELTERENQHLANRNLTDVRIEIRKFDTKEAFLSFVRSFDYIDQYNRPKNHFLNATMCNANEGRRHWHGFPDYRYGVRYYLGYMTHDEKGRVVDLRNYEDELYAFDNKGYITDRNAESYAKWSVKWEANTLKFENREKLCEGKSYWGYYRRIQTTQERRYAAAPEHKPFVRGQRSYANIPNSWDDYYFRREKNWKARDKKARRQWGVNVAKHADTIKMPSRWDCISEDPDDNN